MKTQTVTVCKFSILFLFWLNALLWFLAGLKNKIRVLNFRCKKIINSKNDKT